MQISTGEMLRVWGSPLDVVNFYESNPSAGPMVVTFEFENSHELLKGFAALLPPVDLAAQLPDPSLNMLPASPAENARRKSANPTNITLSDWVNHGGEPVTTWPGRWF